MHHHFSQFDTCTCCHNGGEDQWDAIFKCETIRDAWEGLDDAILRIKSSVSTLGELLKVWHKHLCHKTCLICLTMGGWLGLVGMRKYYC